MTLLAPGTHQVCIHFFDKDVLDFTVIETGERHGIRLFHSQKIRLNIALITQKLDIDNPAGGQVVLTVAIKTDGELAFNNIVRISAPTYIIPFESSVPTPAQLAALPVIDFEDMV